MWHFLMHLGVHQLFSPDVWGRKLPDQVLAGMHQLHEDKRSPQPSPPKERGCHPECKSLCFPGSPALEEIGRGHRSHRYENRNCFIHLFFNSVFALFESQLEWIQIVFLFPPVTNLNLNLVFIAGCLLAAVGMICGVAMYRAKISKVKYQPLPAFES